MVKNLSTEKTQFLHLAAKYKKSNLKNFVDTQTVFVAHKYFIIPRSSFLPIFKWISDGEQISI